MQQLTRVVHTADDGASVPACAVGVREGDAHSIQASKASSAGVTLLVLALGWVLQQCCSCKHHVASSSKPTLQQKRVNKLLLGPIKQHYAPGRVLDQERLETVLQRGSLA